MSWRALLLVCLALAAAVSVDSLRLRLAGSQRRTSAVQSADSVIEDMIEDNQGAEALLELEALAETETDSEYSRFASRRPPPPRKQQQAPSRNNGGSKAPSKSASKSASKSTTPSRNAPSKGQTSKGTTKSSTPSRSAPSTPSRSSPSARSNAPAGTSRTPAARTPTAPVSSKPTAPAAAGSSAQKAQPAAAKAAEKAAAPSKKAPQADDEEEKPKPKPKTATQLRHEARLAALKASRKAFNDALNKIPIRQKRAKVKLDLIRIRKAQETLAKNVLWHREHVQKTAYLAKEQNRKAFEARMASVDEKRIVALKMQLVDNSANLTTTINTLVGLRHRRDELLAQSNEEALKHKDTEAAFHNKEAQEITAKTLELEPQQAILDVTVAKIKKELDALNADYKDEQSHKSSARKYAKEKIDESKAKAQHRAELSKRAALKAIGQIKKKAFKTAQTAAAIDGRVFQGKDDGQKEIDLSEKPLASPPEAPTPPPAYAKYPEQQSNTLVANITAVEAAVANLTGEAREEGMQKAIVSEHKKAMITKLRMAIAKYREEQTAKKKLVAAEQAVKEQDEKSYLRQSQEQGRKRNSTEANGLEDAKSREKIALEAKTQFEKARQIRDRAEATAKSEAVAEEQSAKKRYASAAAQSMKQKALDMATATYKKAAAAAAKSPNPRTTQAAEDARLAMVEAMRQAEQAAAAQAADAAAAQSAKVKADEAGFKANQAIAAVDKVAKDKDAADMAASKAQQKYEQTKIDRKKQDAQAEVDMQNEAQQKLKAKSDAFAANKQRENAAAAKLKEWAEAIISSDDSAVGRKFQLDMGLANPADMPTPSAKMFIELESALPTHAHLRFKRAPAKTSSKTAAPAKTSSKTAAPAKTESDDDGPKMPESVKKVMDELAKQVNYPNAATGKAAISQALLVDAVGDLTGLEGPALDEAVNKMKGLSPIALKGAVDILAHNMMQDEKDAEKLYAAAEPESSESAAKPKDDPELDSEDESEDASIMGPTGDRKLSPDKLTDAPSDVDVGSPDSDSEESSEQALSSGGDEDVDPALSESSLMSESMDPEDAKDNLLGSDNPDSINASPLTPSGLPGGDAPRAAGPSVEINVVNHNVLNARSAPGAKNVQLPESVVNSGLMPSELQAIGDPDAYIKKLSQAALGAQAAPNPVADQAVALTKLVASMVGSQLNSVPETLPSAQPPAPASAPAAPSTPAAAPSGPQAGLTAAPNSAIAGVTPVRFRE